MLQEVGKVLATRFRKEDITARWGGEEFLCCLFNVKLSDIHVIAEDLRKAVAAIKVEGVNDTVTASIGVAVLDPKGGTDFEKAYHNADEALYFAKEAGRNRVEIYPSVNDSVLSLSIEKQRATSRAASPGFGVFPIELS